jgi:hypothetical protein
MEKRRHRYLFSILIAGSAVALFVVVWCGWRAFELYKLVSSESRFRSSLEELRVDAGRYQRQELARGSRGPLFEALALKSNNYRLSGAASLNQNDIVLLWSLPDRTIASDRGLDLIYLYDRFAVKDWAVIVYCDSYGNVLQIGFNDVKALGIDVRSEHSTTRSQ